MLRRALFRIGRGGLAPQVIGVDLAVEAVIAIPVNMDGAAERQPRAYPPAALSGIAERKPGVYCEDCDIAAPTDPESPTARYFGVEPHACSDEAAERLWTLSERFLEAA